MPTSCMLCGGPGPLCESHIVPDFFVRSVERLQPTGAQGQYQPISFLKSSRPEERDGARQRGYWEKKVGLKERLLCWACEGKFQKNETYVRSLFYGTAP